MENISLARKIKSFAFKEGASLAGIAPVSRWAKAPIQHSPEGIFPEARSVVVCALHIPDACVELGTEKDVREPGPALVLKNVSLTLSHLAFRVARFIEDSGWQAIPIPVTCLWNYRPQPGADRGWMADLCHYYAAACAGLGEIGWHNICITPEFGTRQRFISILTDATLHPDPLYSGEPLCDKCMLCATHCPTKSFDKEVCGNCTIEIEDKRYTFPKRNLWRCGIGENFQLDVLRDWPEKIDEKVITDAAEKAVKQHPEWVTGWKMGQCLKWCMNPQRRYFDRDYCKSPRRKRNTTTGGGPEMIKAITKDAMALSHEKGADYFASINIHDLEKAGLDIRKVLPDAKGAILLGFSSVARLSISPVALGTALMVTNHFEKHGYSSLTRSGMAPSEIALSLGIIESPDDLEQNGSTHSFELILTSCPVETDITPLEKMPSIKKNLNPARLTSIVKQALFSGGANLAGIASAEIFDSMVQQASKSRMGNDEYFRITDKGWELKEGAWGNQAMPFNPAREQEKDFHKKASAYLPGARNIIVAGIKLLDAVVENAGKGNGKKAGHYEYSVHEVTTRELMLMLLKPAKILHSLGYRAQLIPFSDADSHFLTANRFAAIAAGLGETGWNGMVLTPEYGPRQLFGAIVTDAPLDADELYGGPKLCNMCFQCVYSCPAKAIDPGKEVSITVGEKTFTWGANRQLACDWACKYGLIKAAGPEYIGSKTDIPVPRNITADVVCKALKTADRLQRPFYKTIVERCFTECSAGKKKQ